MASVTLRCLLMAAPFAPVVLGRLAAAEPPRLTVLYDNYPFNGSCATG